LKAISNKVSFAYLSVVGDVFLLGYVKIWPKLALQTPFPINIRS